MKRIPSSRNSLNKFKVHVIIFFRIIKWITDYYTNDSSSLSFSKENCLFKLLSCNIFWYCGGSLFLHGKIQVKNRFLMTKSLQLNLPTEINKKTEKMTWIQPIRWRWLWFGSFLGWYSALELEKRKWKYLWNSLLTQCPKKLATF